MAKIGIVDVDGHNFPNLALMKISAYHKSMNDSCEWYNGIEHYDKVYVSKVFSFTPDELRVIQADEVIRGGTGYNIVDKWLPDEIEHICPDYSLYPMYDSAYGFTTRGCVNKCSFCIVPKKEGTIREHADIDEFRADKKNIVLMDNNIISCDHGIAQIEKAIKLKVKLDINQGIDARLLAKDKELCKLLSKVKWIDYIRLAYDNSAVTEDVIHAIENMKDVGINARKMLFYLLVKDGEIKDAEKRALTLDYYGASPFAMPYRDLTTKQEPTIQQKRFARWCNVKSVFKSCTFDEYKG